MGRIEIASLTALRGILALWVLFYHLLKFIHLDRVLGLKLPDFIAKILYSGWVAVDFFFVLSGFIIAYIYADTLNTRASIRTFYLKRIFRTYPVHLATLLTFSFCIFALGQHLPLDYWNLPNHLFREFLAKLFLTESWGMSFEPNWYTLSWSLSVEYLCYLLFPLAVLLLKIIPKPQNTALRLFLQCTLIMSCTAFATAFFLDHEGRMNGYWSHYAWIRGMPAFIVGISTFYLSQSYRVNRSVSLALLACATLIYLYFLGSIAGECWFYATYLNIFFPVFIFLLVQVPDFLKNRVFQYLGKISYSLYLSHGMCIALWDYTYRQVMSEKIPYTGFYILILVCGPIALASILYERIEKPARIALVQRFCNVPTSDKTL